MATYPLPKFSFQVTWDGVDGAFTEVSGLDIETEVIEYRAGNMPQTQSLKMPGRRKFGNITLKRGTFKGNNKLYEWWNEILGINEEGKIPRKDVIINLLVGGQPAVVWNVKQAWATKVQSTDLKGDANEVAIETLELAHEGITIEHK